jgi:hypothetical protein
MTAEYKQIDHLAMQSQDLEHVPRRAKSSVICASSVSDPIPSFHLRA